MSGQNGRTSTSSSSSYLALLNSLALDLDILLNDLCANQELTHDSPSRLRGDSFLEPYLQGISSDGNSSRDTSPLLSDGRDESPLLSSNRRELTNNSNNRRSRDTSPQPPNNRHSLHSPNQNTGFQLLSNGGHHQNNGFRTSPSESLKSEQYEAERRACFEEIDSLANQNKHQINEILKLSQSQRDVVSTSRSGNIIHRRPEVFNEEETGGMTDLRRTHTDLNDNTSEETLSQREDELSCSDDAGSENSDGDTPCGIALLERLIRSHPVWFQPDIQRTGAVHLLQGKEEGNFVVRQSSQPDTMAISVRLPPNKGPYIEHYLIQEVDNHLSLESSENRFDTIPTLICYYCQCCDELPVQLTLPRAILDAKNRQQLSSLALLGQEFWRYPMANPKPEDASETTSPTGSLCSFGSANNNKLKGSKNEIILDLAPLPSPTLSTFKSVFPEKKEKPMRPRTLDLQCTSQVSVEPGGTFPSSGGLRSPPISGKTPPPPPPRWAKPSLSPPNSQMSITTTVTFSMQETHLQAVQGTHCESLPPVGETDTEPPSLSLNLSSPSSEHSLPFTNIASPHSEQTYTPQASRLHTLVSPISDTTNMVSKGFRKIETARSLVSTPTEKNCRSGKRYRRDKKESQHYREFDILSETQYYKSELVDKQSDYEDVWATEPLKTFKPDPSNKPDLLEKLSKSAEAEISETGKQTSPFYAEPADSLKPEVIRRQPRTSPGSARHSDPSHFAHWPTNPYLSGGNLLPRIDSRTELTDSRSADNILNMRTLSGKPQKKNFRAKAVLPPRVTSKTEPSWTVDSSWEFIGQEGDKIDRRGKFPSLEQQIDSEYKDVTVRQIIAKRFPNLRLQQTVHPRSHHIPSPPSTLLSRVSAYDNLESRRDPCEDIDESAEEEEGTVLSESWDVSRYGDNLMMDCGSESTIKVGGDAILDTEDDETVFETPKKPRPLNNRKSFKDRMDPLLSPPRLQALRGKELTGTGSSIRAYALHLASDKTTTFAQNIDNFIACTLESKESNPQVVMRNMRQFMSGMKNYLVKHGEKEFEKHVEKERMKLKSTEFLNLDAILESVMHKLVVRPLKAHLYKLFVDEYSKSGAIQILHENILCARTKPLTELGVKSYIIPPSEASLQKICEYISALQDCDSPLDKLEYLLTCIATIFNSVKSNQRRTLTLGADDFLPLFVWVLVQSGFIAAEIEAEYMWGLLHPSLLSGEGGYYLTTLFSAVHVLKNFKICQKQQCTNNGPGREVQSLLKVVVPDESHGSILTTTLPMRPHMTTKDVTKILAHKVRITNPQDYGLFKLVDGEETLLADNEDPQDVKAKTIESGKHCMLAYKRIDAKIAWPNT